MLKFMGLELLKGSTKNDNKVDVFSFGVVVFFILSGREMPKISIIEQGCWKKARIIEHQQDIHQLINSCWSTSSSDHPSFTKNLSFIKKNKFK
ncbi:hypothetical protein M9Y10_031771 [Tritrichomonas musculus]|uniref:Serine-threonine/tyrosine-protein kinase catalytic domain-containing protein n=1 Tax=Tritrichomonas musculus TaxID=1915356 RepID=A0ABR2H0M8_9EUKA